MTDDLNRYQRQMLLTGWGGDAQRKLAASKVLLLGCGALGSVTAEMLTRAGVGQLRIVDRDVVELSNLHRQVLFDEDDVQQALPKAQAAKRRLERINAQVEVVAIVDDLDHRNIEAYAAGVDLLIDGLDNFEARYLANDYAVQQGVPYLYGAAVGTVGTALTILPHRADGSSAWAQLGGQATPCLRCLFEEAPPPGTLPTCDTVGVLGPVVATVANYQAAEALKILTGHIARANPTLLHVDLWDNTIRQLQVAKAYTDGHCPCCKQRRFEYLDGSLGSSASVLCGRDAVQLRPVRSDMQVNFDEIAERLRPHARLLRNPFMLRATLQDRGKDYVLSLFADGRTIVHGTSQPDVARNVYARYVGS